MYAEFELDIPDRLEDALALLADGGEGTLPMAGGTNMIVDMRARRVAPKRLVSLARLGGLRGIRRDGAKIRLGGATTMTGVLASALLAEHAPSLVAQARVFAGQMVRNTATVAGNICSGSPAADVLPPLLALGADAELTSRAGTRRVALDAFFQGYKQMERRPDELMTEIAFDVAPERSTDLFYKLARRHGDAITVVGLAVAMTVEDGRCASARIALGSVAPYVKRARAAETMLVGEALTPDLIEAAAARAVEESDPIDDVRATAHYRRHSVKVLTRRLLNDAWTRLAS